MHQRGLALAILTTFLTQGTISEPYSAITPKPGGSSLRLQVEDLHLQGLSLAEISRRLGLHPTEVKMALDLARLKAE
jgi:hypothetical protein